MDAKPLETAELEALLEFYAANGVNCALDDVPHNRFSEMREAREARMAAMTKSHNAPQNQTQPAPNLSAPHFSSQNPSAPSASAPSQRASYAQNQSVPDQATVETARAFAASAKTLEELHKALDNFEGCNLKE